jgi:hypothetical protein
MDSGQKIGSYEIVGRLGGITIVLNWVEELKQRMPRN